ncbi:MAG: hypothetical protein ACLRMZ_02155 [Blautia marasmi]
MIFGVFSDVGLQAVKPGVGNITLGGSRVCRKSRYIRVDSSADGYKSADRGYMR